MTIDTPAVYIWTKSRRMETHELHSSEKLFRRVSQVDVSSSNFPTFLVLLRFGTESTSNDLMSKADTDQFDGIVQFGKILNVRNEFDNPRVGTVSGSGWRSRTGREVIVSSCRVGA